MSDILRSRQFAPHGSILSPVSVVADESNQLVVRKVGAVGAGVHGVGGGIGADRGLVVIVLRAQIFRPGFLHNVNTGQEVENLQGVRGLAFFVQLRLDQHSAVHVGNAVDVGSIAGVGAVLDLGADVPGRNHVIRGHGGAVGPLGGALDLAGQLGQVVVPGVVAVGQQGIQFAVQGIVHIQGFEHGGPGATGRGRQDQTIVHVVAQRVVSDDRIPLLAAEVQGLFAGKILRSFSAGNCCHAQHESESQNQGNEFLHRVYPPLKYVSWPSRPGHPPGIHPSKRPQEEFFRFDAG